MRGGFSGMGRPRRRGPLVIPPKAILEVPPGMETPLAIVPGLVLKGTQVRGAAFSPDGVYRYALWRVLSSIVARDVHTGETHVPTTAASGDFVVIGLNPSTADESEDDPTIRRCISFARREGCARLVMLNLYAFRSTDPKGLFAPGVEPEGPLNPDVVSHFLLRAMRGKVVAAWGAVQDELGPMPTSDAIVDCAVPVLCFGRTKGGYPKHPLYLKATTPLEPFITPFVTYRPRDAAGSKLGAAVR